MSARKPRRDGIDGRLGAVLAEIAQLANITAELLVDQSLHATAAGEQLALKIGALADAGRAMLDEGPAVRGDLTDWLAPWLKEADVNAAPNLDSR